MADGQYSGGERDGMLRRVAIVLSSLPPAVAAELIGTVPPGSKQAVRRAMSTLQDVDPLERRRAFQAFQVSIQQQSQSVKSQTAESTIHPSSGVVTSSERDSDSSASRVVAGQSVRQATAWPTLESDTAAASPMAFLNVVEDSVLLRLLRGEHPQTIALVFASVSPEKAGRVLPLLDARTQTETLSRIGRLQELPEAAIADVAEHFKQRIREQGQDDPKSHGKNALEAILAAMPAAKRTPAVATHQPAGDSPSSPTSSPTARSESPRSEFPRSEQPTHELAHKLKIAEQTLPGSIDNAVPEDSHRPSRLWRPDRATQHPSSGLAVNLESTDAIARHLEQMSPIVLCQALGKVDTRTAMLALCGLPNRVAEAALSKLPKAESKKVRAAMNSLGSLNLRDIDDAKEAVARASVGSSASIHRHAPVAA